MKSTVHHSDLTVEGHNVNKKDKYGKWSKIKNFISTGSKEGCGSNDLTFRQQP